MSLDLDAPIDLDTPLYGLDGEMIIVFQKPYIITPTRAVVVPSGNSVLVV